MAPTILTVAPDWPVPPVPVQLKVNVVALVSAAVLSLPAVALVPLQPPDPVHDVAFVDDHVNVLLPPLATEVGDADSDTVGVEAVTETDALFCVVPPEPVQLSVKVVLALSAPVLAEPETTFVPLQPPDAVHVVALVEDQVSVLLLPLLTEVGDADNETVGAGVEAVTATEALAWPVPPAPVQLSVKEVVALKPPVLAEPEVALVPLHPPDAAHDVASVDDQVNVLLAPLATEVGDAERLTVGAGVAAVTETEALFCVVPPAPAQLSVKVVLALSAPVLADPEVVFVPLHPPDAVHDVASVDDQVNVLLAPLVTEVGDAERLTVGAGVEAVTETEALFCVVPPEPVQLSVKVELAVRPPVLAEPEVALAPLQPPDAVQDAAFEDDHVRVLAPPLATVVGEADRLMVGKGVEPSIETEALACPVPPAPVQVSVKVELAVRPPVLSAPEVARVPLQPPDAVHDVALVDDHVRVLAALLAMVVGDADNVTVGCDVDPPTVTVMLACAVRPLELEQVIVNVDVAFNAPVL